MTTTTSSSFSSGAESQRGGRMKQPSSSFNPVYNSVTIDTPQSSVLYEELPQVHLHHEQQQHIPTNQPPGLQQPPPFESTFLSGRTTTNNTIYASSGGTIPPHPDKTSTQVYQYDPQDLIHVDKQPAGCGCTCEAAIFVMAMLLVLLAGAALTMLLLLWHQVIAVQTATPTIATIPVPTDCPCEALLAQRGSYMTLLTKVQNIQIELDSLTNETERKSTVVRIRLDKLVDQLENFTQTIETDRAQPLPSSVSSTASFEPLLKCENETTYVCNIGSGIAALCSGGLAEIVNEGLEVLTRFSCYLHPVEDHGPPNGSTFIQASASGSKPSIGAYGIQEAHQNSILENCVCFLYEAYPAEVLCMRTSIRCPSTVASLPATFAI